MTHCSSCGAALQGAAYCPNCGAANGTPSHSPAAHSWQPHPTSTGFTSKGFRRDYWLTYVILLAGIFFTCLSYFVFRNGLVGEAQYIDYGNTLTYLGLACLVFSFVMNYRIALAIGVGMCAMAGLLFLAYGTQLSPYADIPGVAVDLGIKASLVAMVVSYIFAARKIGMHPAKFSQTELKTLTVPKFIARGQSSRDPW